MKVISLEKLSYDVNDSRLDKLDDPVASSGQGRIDNPVVRNVLNDTGGKINIVYRTAYARASGGTTNKCDFNTFGVLCVPYDFFPKGSLINSSQKDIFFVFDTCEGYKSHTYPYSKAEVHINYLMRHLPKFIHAFTSMFNRGTTLDEIQKNTLFILLSPEEMASIGVKRSSISLQKGTKLEIDHALKKASTDINASSILNIIKQAEPVINKYLADLGLQKSDVSLSEVNVMDISSLNGEQITNLILTSVKEKNIIHTSVRGIIEAKNKEFNEKLQEMKIVPTKNFLKVYQELDHLIKTSIRIKGVNNESSLIIYGPPGVGKTFAVDAYRHMNNDEIAFAFISGDPDNITAYRNDLIGRNIVTAKDGGTQNEYVPGQFVIALSDAIVNKKKALNVVINEFNRSASLGKLDQIIRDVGDTGIIRIEAQADMEELVNVIKEKYGIEAKFKGGFIEIDTNNVDGKGTRVPVTFTLIGNLPDKDLSASSLGVHEEIPAALVRRSQTRRLEYPNPYTKQGLEELRLLLLYDRHFELILTDYISNISIINGVETDMLLEDVIKAIENNDFTFIKQQYGEVVFNAVNEFVGNSDNSIVEQTLAFYNNLYDMYQNGKMRIVPSISEILTHFETMLGILHNSVSLQDVQDDITDAFKQFVDKYVSFKLIDVDEAEDSFKDFVKIWTNHMLKPALLYDYFNIVFNDVLKTEESNGREK